MCQPDYPTPDGYINNTMVPIHLSKTPDLKFLPVDSYLKQQVCAAIGSEVRTLLKAVYKSHGVSVCDNMGLYFGWQEWHQYGECEKIPVLVVEIMAREMGKWREIDTQVPAIARALNAFEGLLKIPVRYYESRHSQPIYYIAVNTYGVRDPPPPREQPQAFEDLLAEAESRCMASWLENCDEGDDGHSFPVAMALYWFPLHI